MLTAEHTFEVNRPVEEVFGYITDVSNLPEWQAAVSEVRLESEGPLQVGARFTEVRTFLGRRLESTLEVTECEPNRIFSLKALSGPVPFEVRHLFEASEGSTRIAVSGAGGTGGLFKVADALVKRTAERAFRKDFGTLKAILERRGTKT